MEFKSWCLKVDSSTCQLPGVISNYFVFEDTNTLLDEGMGRNPFRMFIPKHPQINDIIPNIGKDNSFILFRVLFSLYDASHMLYKFVAKNKNISSDITFNEIQKTAQSHNIEDYQYYSLNQNTYLTFYNFSREKDIEEHYFEVNEFQELFWAMNLKGVLSEYSIDYFELYKNDDFEEEEKNTGNTDLLINKMLSIREVAMVMHTWRKLNSYRDANIINNISSILEFIKKDVENNKRSFATDREEFAVLENLIHIANRSKRPLYFGLFNSANHFGFFSRHGSHSLTAFNKISKDTTKDIETIRNNMDQGIIPNNEEIKHMFDVWHYTTSLIVTYWFRVKIVD